MRQLLSLGIMVVLMGVSLAADRAYFEVVRRAGATFNYTPLYFITPVVLCLQAILIVLLFWSALPKARSHIPAAVVLIFTGTICMFTSSFPGTIALSRGLRSMPFDVNFLWLGRSGLAASAHTGAIVATIGLAVIVWALIQGSQKNGEAEAAEVPAAE